MRPAYEMDGVESVGKKRAHALCPSIHPSIHPKCTPFSNVANACACIEHKHTYTSPSYTDDSSTGTGTRQTHSHTYSLAYTKTHANQKHTHTYTFFSLVLHCPFVCPLRPTTPISISSGQYHRHPIVAGSPKVSLLSLRTHTYMHNTHI